MLYGYMAFYEKLNEEFIVPIFFRFFFSFINNARLSGSPTIMCVQTTEESWPAGQDYGIFR